MVSRFARLRTAATIATISAAMMLGMASAPSASAAPGAAGKGTIVARLTGPGAINDTIGKYNVFGTDLGVLWDNGHGEIMAAFGDTQSINGWSWLYGEMFYWRSNVLLKSRDHNLANGMTFSGHVGRPGHAKRLLKPTAREITIIPTAGVAANGKQYMSIMAVNHWGNPGTWKTRFSGLAVSSNNGRDWKAVNAFRPNGGGNRKFQMSAFMKEGGYVYIYGTPPGRAGAVYLARVPEAKIENLGAYEYFSWGKWVKGNTGAATPVMSAPTGELSVAYNKYLGKYISLATRNGVVLRTADRPEGPWTSGQTVVPENDPYSGYAPYIHPWSLSSPTLYFTYSISLGYQVYLMRLSLRK
ncbi:hypothetical protein GOEFS_018_00760 [Gordonia effusa NBRC 100432]|uniref:DUF4185 domain-containing protein n=1 Tax=Gordonia effusa NBRC 100432 TaxID=1077974 RepID=H0QW43_9ACTN|nr:DUF4185 domain-containing protein [Gordonia effusa]GAB17044.1 hypothetical protein GOEFS_018_00760 [Gordonia effusa NBRC 100432]